MQTRAREIVKQAAKQTKNAMVKSWLHNDERGTWERTASDLIYETNPKARLLGLSETEQDAQIAIKLGFLALTAALNNAKKGSTK
jgi:hypothetical protein